MISTTIAGASGTNSEENFCFKCHDADGPATSNIQGEFGLAVRHRVIDTDQAGDGRDAECSTCHGTNMHQLSSLPARANSNAVSGLIANAPKGYNGSSVVTPPTKEYELCFLCHSNYGGSGMSQHLIAGNEGELTDAFQGIVDDIKYCN